MSNKNIDIKKILKNFNKDKKVITYLEDTVNAIGKILDRIDDSISKK